MTSTLPHLTGAVVIPLEGEVGPAAVIALQRRVARALAGGQRRVIVDLGAVSGLGGQTLSLFCGVLRYLSRRGATLAIAGGPAGVRRLAARCDLGGVELHPTIDAALGAVTAQAHLGARGVAGGGRPPPAGRS
jgi:anti-anti-sigma regulatory factor